MAKTVFKTYSVFSLSLCGSACFLANGYLLKDGWLQLCFHVLLVQWPLLAALVVATNQA